MASLLSVPLLAQQEGAWTLQQCIDHALSHNLQLKQSRASEQTAAINLTQARAGLLPSLNANISQGLSYRPFQESGSSLVNGGVATQAANKLTQNGSYGINASWTVWNGGRNRLNIRSSELESERAELSTQAQANSIQEQIAQLYVQILYMQEAATVNEELLRHDSLVWARGKEFVREGQMSRADLAQLQAQVSSGRYDVVNVRTQIANLKMQLKQLLEIAPTNDIDIAATPVSEAQVLNVIPAKLDIYAAALASRPEIRSSETAILQSETDLKLARAGYMPDINLSANLGDSHITGTSTNFFNQIKNNFAANLGVSVSIPIFDNRANKSNVERAEVSQLMAELQLQEAQRQLFSTVEGYWLNATNAQQKYIAARDNVHSRQTGYDLCEEQFRLGLKNIVELLTARGNLLQAKQDLLQDKYTTVLNRALLNFYAGQPITL